MLTKPVIQRGEVPYKSGSGNEGTAKSQRQLIKLRDHIHWMGSDFLSFH